jgi:hypothetical protein
MQTSFDVPLQMILTGIAALIHWHCRYKTGLPITSSYYQKPLTYRPSSSYPWGNRWLLAPLFLTTLF